MQERTLGEIAEHMGGRVCGDPNIRTRAAATLSHAGPGDLSFLVNRKYEKQLASTKADAVIVGQVGVVGHITIGNHVTIGAQAGVVNSIPDGETVLGAPAIGAGQARRAYTMLPYLPQMRQDIRTLQNQLEELAAEMKAKPQV
ncbi:MAG: hypothetical protein NTZ17_09045 [Phycisphaerae bacterium]|nr:hypothetical protein [Phycisphaerae bacterium]